jgi:hypothetical protein
MKREEFAGLLGLGGLIPFVGLALITTSPDAARVEMASKALILYGAIILTFIGGLHWGVLLATPNHRLQRRGHLRYLWSVIPSLYAWPVAQLAASRALPALAIGLFIAWIVDVRIYREQGNLSWFIKLRTLLTFVACTSLMFAWWTLRNK